VTDQGACKGSTGARVLGVVLSFTDFSIKERGREDEELRGGGWAAMGRTVGD